MGRRRHAKGRRRNGKAVIAAACVLLVLFAGLLAAAGFERQMAAPVENAGQQVTAYKTNLGAAQYFVDGRWIAEKEMETLLVIDIDDFGKVTGSDSYNNGNQADFLMLLVNDPLTGSTSAIHLNRDTMAEIPILGVTGQQAGTEFGQLALAYTYGRGEQDSCQNTVRAVSNLLYGIKIDHYITVTMDAVPILNDWVGGVTLEVMDDFSGVDDTLVKGQVTTLKGIHALNYVRTRKNLEDSTNLHRMERQRQYAAAWLQKARPMFGMEKAVMELVLSLSDYHYSDCTAEQLTQLLDLYSQKPPQMIHELEGENVLGEVYMEYYVNDEAVEQLVVDMFFAPVAEQ